MDSPIHLGASPRSSANELATLGHSGEWMRWAGSNGFTRGRLPRVGGSAISHPYLKPKIMVQRARYTPEDPLLTLLRSGFSTLLGAVPREINVRPRHHAPPKFGPVEAGPLVTPLHPCIRWRGAFLAGPRKQTGICKQG